MPEVKRPRVAEYFAGKNIFVTGATGFIGKVLIEKLLRSCPKVNKIYVLIRQKKGKTPESRIKDFTDLPLYDVLKKEHPENLEKIVPVIGDVELINLGLRPKDRKELIDNVNIIYHSAATVRFNDHLKNAIILNTRGTRELIQIAKEMNHLEVFLHFSTAYCNTDKKLIEEEIYPPHADWRSAIELAEKVDPHLLDVLTEKYIQPLPNTYTFTKSMGEHVVKDLCDGHIPTVIFRPSIVISSMTEPFPGWVDSYNGPMGIFVASGKGVLRTVFADKSVAADYVPCDSVVKAVIIATWEKALQAQRDCNSTITVCNASCNKISIITIGEVLELGTRLRNEIPLNNMLWYPSITITDSWILYYFKTIFYQLIPALILDALLIIIGKKPMLVKLQRRLFIASMALSYFLTNNWEFKNQKVLQLQDLLSPEDMADFSYQLDHENTVPYNYFKLGLIGARRYLLNEPDSTIEQAVLHANRMWTISQVFNAVWYMAFMYILIYLSKVTGVYDLLLCMCRFIFS